MGSFNDLFPNNGEIDTDDIIDKYEKKLAEKATNKNNVAGEEIWSERMGDSTLRFSNDRHTNEHNASQHVINNHPSSINPQKNRIDLNLDDAMKDTPGTYIKNNQTINLRSSQTTNLRPGQTTNLNNQDIHQDPFKSRWEDKSATRNLNQNVQNPSVSDLDRTRQPMRDFTQNTQPIPLRKVPVGNNNPMGVNNVEKPQGVNNQPYGTKILFNENLTPNAEDLTREINDAQNITIGANQHAEKVRKVKIDKFNETPKFLKFEYKHAMIGLILAIIFFLAILGGLGYTAYAAMNLGQSYYLFIPGGLIAIFGLCHYISAQMKFGMLAKDIKSHNYKVEKGTPLASIRKLYQRLVTANITLNWMSATVYMLMGLAVLLTFIVTFSMNIATLYSNDFTRLIIGADNYLPLYFVYTFAGVAGFTLLVQIVYNFINRKRRNDMELFYETPIIPEDVVVKYRKQANMRGLITFLIATVVAGLVVLIFYLVLKRKNKK